MTDHLDRQRHHLAELLGLDPDDPAVWRALAVQEGEMVGAEDTPGRDNGQDQPHKHNTEEQGDRGRTRVPIDGTNADQYADDT